MTFGLDMRRQGILALIALGLVSCAPGVEPEPGPPERRFVRPDGGPARVAWPRPHVGVLDSVSYRYAELGPRVSGAVHGRARLRPVSLREQIADLNYTAFHFRVFADPNPGRFVGLGAGGIVALRQPGLKVLPAGGLDQQAECFTLMTCLMALDAASQARPEHPPLVVILEPADPEVLRPEWRRRWRDPTPGAISQWVPRRPAEALPDALAIAREVEAVLAPERRANGFDASAEGKFIIVVLGQGGAPPNAPYLVAGERGRDTQIVFADDPDWRLEHARAESSFVIVHGADWRGDDNDHQISAVEAATGLADVVLLTQPAARAS